MSSSMLDGRDATNVYKVVIIRVMVRCIDLVLWRGNPFVI